MDHEGRLRELHNLVKHSNMRMIGIPEDEDRDKGEDLFQQSIAKNFPNLGKDTDINIEEAQRTPVKFNKSQPSPRHIVVKFTKYTDKERILKVAREKRSLAYKERQIRFAVDLYTETWQARKKCKEIFNMLNGKNMQPRILYPARLSFRIEREIKSFPYKQKLKEFVTTKPPCKKV